MFEPGIVMEGGSIDVNGRGTLLTTEACLLNPNRNPQLDRAEIEAYLRDYLGVAKILWLGDGIAGDDTDGHVDDLTRFVDERTVVTVVEDDPADENYEPLQENLERLRGHDRPGRPAAPGGHAADAARRCNYDGQRLPASYANFYIANGVVLLPTYDPPRDEEALATLADPLPRPATWSASTAPTWSGGSAPSTASPSSGRPESGLLPGPHQRRAPAAAVVHAHARDVELVLGPADHVAGVGRLARAAGRVGLEQQRVAHEVGPALHVHRVRPPGRRQHQLHVPVSGQVHLHFALAVQVPRPVARVLRRLAPAADEDDYHSGQRELADGAESIAKR